MVDFGSKEDSASYREEDAAKTGHAVGSRGPGGGNEKRAHGARRFIERTACTVRYCNTVPVWIDKSEALVEDTIRSGGH